MQKKIIALAIAGLASTAAFAQSNVTVYGRVDYGWMSRGGDDGLVNTNGRKDEMGAGLQAGSRIGFKGSEDLGNGLKAIFQVETGLQNDQATGAAGIWSGTHRNAYVGLTSAWGTFVGGRLDGVRYGTYNKYDAFQGGGMGNFTQMTLQVDRADNAIAWVSPKWSGFSVVLAHARSVGGAENQTGALSVLGAAPATDANTKDGRLYTMSGTYENGPISLTFGHEQVRYNDHNDPLGGNLKNEKVTTAAGSYDFNFMKVYALWDKHTADNSRNFAAGDVVDYTAWNIGATVPYGNFLFKVGYGRVNDDTNAASRAATAAALVHGDASKWGIGVNYYLSKRTNIYADYGHISNDNNANYTISPSANAMGGQASNALWSRATGYGTNGFNIGLAHNF